MGQIYGSPAFTRRTDDELLFLRTVDGITGFSLFWPDIIRPMLCELQAKHLLEIGASRGDLTRLLLQYCDTFGASLLAIEPVVTSSLHEVVGRSSRVRLYAEKSETALPRVAAPVDSALLEGDQNYYTVRNDLIAIGQLSYRQKHPFPTVFIKNTSWPYARRDMYYDPGSIAVTERHEYATSGMTPWSSHLQDGMINHPFANARHEGGPKNGVLTAVEDFITESGLPLGLFTLPLNHGLGIIYARGSRAEEFVRNTLIPPPLLGRFLETCELARLNEIIRRLQPDQTHLHVGYGVRNRLVYVLRKLGRRIIRMIEP